MKKQLVTDYRLIWLLFLILPGIAYAGYLKSTGNLKVLEGETCHLHWDAYSKEAAVAPCSWWYAHSNTEDSSLFLAYEDGRRYHFGDGSLWQFTNIQEPCSGGLQKNVTLEDAGVYSMQTEKGILPKTDSEITLEVFNGSDLSFLVSVNGKVSNLDLNECTWSLELLKTHSPVNVSVALSKTFPSTTVITISNGEEVSCDDPYKQCYQVTDLSQTSNVSILIKIETEIIGANQILITQPLAYSGNRAKNVYAALFYVLLLIDIIIIISIIVWFVKMRRRPYRQADVEGEMKRGENLSLKQRVKNIKNDVMEAFLVNNQPGHDEMAKIHDQQNCLITTLEKQVREAHEIVNSEIKKCNNDIDNMLLSADDLIQKCQEILKKMADTEKEMESIGNSGELNIAQKTEYGVLKLQMKLITEREKWLKGINNCCNRSNMKKILQKESDSNDKNPEIETAEEATAKTGMINKNVNKWLEDVLKQNEKIMDLKCELLKLEEMLNEIQIIMDCVREKSDLIDDAGKEITDIRTHFDKIQKGWEYSQRGSSAAAGYKQRDESVKKGEKKSPMDEKDESMKKGKKNSSKKEKKEQDPKKKWWNLKK